ncbi:hypothetical protein [Mycobacterium asiaticum]|uniref:hypothetical protein n=1 Tax=Mycobacterium asiaticum TaxID=1790 RepID=UPI0007EF75C8|nr:hypothetical protein [Mycobacterium asiaticum]OBI91167.1 hypothetical protein A5661_27655 [Mycobacterium asiaticum]
MENLLAHMDQVSFLGVRALGYGALVQFSWIYDRPVDLDQLRRFHENLGYGLLGRRVERSPLPFARDRWVSCRGPRDVDVAATSRARSEVNAWAYERACLPIDPERGPSWHLGVLPLTDGGSAVCLTASHTVVDGLGFLQAIADAVHGRRHHFGYPLPGSRARRRAVVEDGRLTIASAPQLARALAATGRVVRNRRSDVRASFSSGRTSRRGGAADHPVVVPSVTAYIDLADWDARAKNLGGNSHTLLAGFAARLGVRTGRVCPDGTVNLSLPISDRTKDDTRGNAMVLPVASVDPTGLTADLTEVRGKAKLAFTDLSRTSDELLATLPLTSMAPKWLARRTAGVGMGSAQLPIGCSNMGDLDPVVNRPDGTDADYAAGRLVEPGISKRVLERMRGQLFLVSGRIHGRLWISLNAYLPGVITDRQELKEAALRTLDEFGLTAEIHG